MLKARLLGSTGNWGLARQGKADSWVAAIVGRTVLGRVAAGRVE